MKKINNKGFTLIEIIGIVVILAVIMIVTVPALENTLRNTKIKELESFKKNLVLVCDNYILNNKNNMAEILNNGVELSVLLVENYIDEIPESDESAYSRVLVTINSGEYKYQLCKTDNSCESIN